MQKGEVLIAENGDEYQIKVSGRANFECGVPLRDFAKKLKGARLVSIDLQECVGMDSTFMGILSLIGLKGKSTNMRVQIVNAGDFNRGLLRGLGVEKLFDFIDKNEDSTGSFSEISGNGDALNTAETVVEAHKTLIDVDSACNLPKFEKVVEFAESDLERLRKEKDNANNNG